MSLNEEKGKVEYPPEIKSDFRDLAQLITLLLNNRERLDSVNEVLHTFEEMGIRDLPDDSMVVQAVMTARCAKAVLTAAHMMAGLMITAQKMIEFLGKDTKEPDPRNN